MNDAARKVEEAAPEIERELGLFVTDEELMKRLGLPREKARAAIAMHDRQPQSGFPKKDPLWGDRRYWPAVKAWFDRKYKVTLAPSITPARPSNER